MNPSTKAHEVHSSYRHGMTGNDLSTAQEALRAELFASSFGWLEAALPVPISQSWRLLEVGAGRRGWAPLYADHVAHVVALDLRDYSRENPGVEYVIADLTADIPIASKSFDIAVSHSVLEHVADLGATLSNVDRVLKLGGYAFLTVAPLYYSAQGAHMKARGVNRWEHLDPERPFHLTDNPMPHDPGGGHFLNQMTWSDVLAAVGRLPWEIVKTKVMMDPQPMPEWLAKLSYPEMDLRCRGFFLLARKLLHLHA